MTCSLSSPERKDMELLLWVTRGALCTLPLPLSSLPRRLAPLLPPLDGFAGDRNNS